MTTPPPLPGPRPTDDNDGSSSGGGGAQPPYAGAVSCLSRFLAVASAPRTLALAALVAALGGAVALWFRPPGPGSLYFPCLFNRATGWYCPGCGITRALHAFLHGQWRAAFSHNLLGLPVLLVAAIVLLRPEWHALRHNRWRPPPLPASTAWWLLGIGITFAVLRNLPWPPFTALAP
ncbi:MAG: DUF2752 domain-containing protein [Opitutaceae bacterium]|nr:DUF2752 domain-containing protein [Opitutaceae bacterium]